MLSSFEDNFSVFSCSSKELSSTILEKAISMISKSVKRGEEKTSELRFAKSLHAKDLSQALVWE